MRVVVQQPEILKYRVPFFREWSNRENISLKLFYGRRSSEIANDPMEGIDATCLPVKSWGFAGIGFRWQPAQWKNAARKSCDVLVLSWNVRYISLVPALLRARKNKIKTILWGHGFSKNENWLRKTVRDSVGRLADALVFYDFATAEQFRSEGWPPDKIYVAPNSLDQTEIQSASDEWLSYNDRLQRFQAEQGLAGRENIIYIGRIYRENRLDLLIEALPAIRRARPDVQLLVIGGENDEARHLYELVEKLGLSDCVKWLGAIYSEFDIAAYMLSSRLFCYPANIGLSIMHAMGYGIPVVTGNDIASHNPEIQALADGENGRLYQHLNVKDLSTTIVEMLADPDKTAAMGNAAKKHVLMKFTTVKMVDGFMDAINAVARVDSK